MMKRLRHALIPLLLGFSAVLCSPGSASAGFLTGFTGNTQMSNDASSDGIVNFAVFERTGISWVTDLGLVGVPTIVAGGGVIDATANYVYFYEVVNNNPVGGTPDPALRVLKILSGDNPYTSAGYLSATVFTDSAGAVGPAGNQFLGTEGPKPDDVVDGAPSQSGVTPVGFTADGTAAPPTFAILGGIAFGGFAEFDWTLPNIAAGAYSDVIFLTSNVSPTYGHGDLRDGSAPSDGDIPVQAPEPATLITSMLGIMGLAGSYGWRRWRGLPQVAVA